MNIDMALLELFAKMSSRYSKPLCDNFSLKYLFFIVLVFLITYYFSKQDKWLALLNIPNYSWLELFARQPLLVEQWQNDNQLEAIDSLFKFATEIKDSHNFSTLVDILNKEHSLVNVFALFLTEHLKTQLVLGMDFFSYQKAQTALSEFRYNSSHVLGLNMSLAISQLALTLRESQK